jgi:hypothetical protein
VVKLGFLVPHLGGTQLAFRLIYNVNKASHRSIDKDIVVFYENIVKPCYTVGFMTTNVADAWSYPGPMIATNLSTAHKIIQFPGPPRKYFYVWDLEWKDIPNKKYEALAEIYHNPKLELIARSDHHAKAIEHVWGRSVKAVVEDCDIDQLFALTQAQGK